MRIIRAIKYILSFFPLLRKVVRYIYFNLEFIRYILKRNKPFLSAYNIQPILYKDQETFFGYYDKSPTTNEGLILAHASKYKTKKLPPAGKSITVFIYDKNTGRVIFEKETMAFNWQQGARAQWVDDNTIIFNEYCKIKGQYQARISNINGNIQDRIINFPIYDCFEDKFALSLSYERLNELRPDYGYRAHKYKFELFDYKNDGLFFINLKTGAVELRISLQQIIDFQSNESIKKAKNHKINHIMISPSGENAIFLHRYFINNKKTDRFFLYNIQKNTLDIISNSSMVSHFCWVDNEHVFGYMNMKNSDNGFYTVNTNTKKYNKNKAFNCFDDGHPTHSQNEILCDTYPRKECLKRLYIYKKKTNKIEVVAKVFEKPVFENECRCDLHPRWGRSNKEIFFDSIHIGKRQLYLMDLNDQKN